MERFFRILKNRYVYTGLFFIFWISFIDDTNFFRQRARSRELSAILEKKEKYTAEISDLERKIADFDSNIRSVETYAREKYRMQKSNEDIFIFQENNK